MTVIETNLQDLFVAIVHDKTIAARDSIHVGSGHDHWANLRIEVTGPRGRRDGGFIAITQQDEGYFTVCKMDGREIPQGEVAVSNCPTSVYVAVILDMLRQK